MSDITPGYTFASGERNVTHTKLNASAGGSVGNAFFTTRSADTAPAGATATLVFYDSATGTQKKAILNNLVFNHAALLASRSAFTELAGGDLLLAADISDANAYKKATLTQLATWLPTEGGAVTAALTALTPDPADLLLAFDASATNAPMKLLLSALRDMILPTGLVVPMVGSVPASWLECDGSAIVRADYAALHTVLKDIGGTNAYGYGSGDGSTTFNLPDFRGRSIIGSGTGTMAETISAVNTTTDVLTVPANNWLHTGVMVRYASTGLSQVDLTSGTDYYVIRWAEDGSTIKLATTYAGAMSGTGIDLTDATLVGTHTLTTTLTARTIGQQRIGAEIAPIGATQFPTLSTALLTNAVTATAGSNAVRLNSTTNGNYVAAASLPKDSPSSAELVNNLPPSAVARWIIKT